MSDTNVQGDQIDPGEIDAAFVAVRTHANKSQYGQFITDQECRAVATEVVTAIETWRKAPSI